jgi:hypothetical protein
MDRHAFVGAADARGVDADGLYAPLVQVDGGPRGGRGPAGVLLRYERGVQVLLALLALDAVPVPIGPEEDDLARRKLAVLLLEGFCVVGLDKRADPGLPPGRTRSSRPQPPPVP